MICMYTVKGYQFPHIATTLGFVVLLGSIHTQCTVAGYAGLGFCPVEAPSRATERKVSFSQDTSFVHHMCSQSQNFIRLALVVKLFASGTDNFNSFHMVSFPFVAWRRVVKIQKGHGQ